MRQHPYNFRKAVVLARRDGKPHHQRETFFGSKHFVIPQAASRASIKAETMIRQISGQLENSDIFFEPFERNENGGVGPSFPKYLRFDFALLA